MQLGINTVKTIKNHHIVNYYFTRFFNVHLCLVSGVVCILNQHAGSEVIVQNLFPTCLNILCRLVHPEVTNIPMSFILSCQSSTYYMDALIRLEDYRCIIDLVLTDLTTKVTRRVFGTRSGFFFYSSLLLFGLQFTRLKTNAY